MNNLKFRAYIKSIQMIVDVVEIDLKNKMTTLDIATNEVCPEFSFWWKETELPFSQVIIMQSTGLKDKNGVEIFEGDVVENSAFGIYAKNKYDNYGFEDFADENTKEADVVVIGNIYENKER